MNNLTFYAICLGIPLVIGLWAQHKVKSTFQHWSQVPEDTGLTGADVARRVLDANGLQGVPVNPVAGALTDHYDPRTRSVNLSEPVYGASTVSSTAVAAHECGHAIQHAKAYVPMTVRSALWPVTAFASSTWTILLLIGVVLQATNLVIVAVALYSAVVLFQFVTLPVEFDASRRAAVQLRELGIANADEAVGVRKVLTSAALTYVAGALAALSQLIYFATAFLGNRS